MSLKIWNVQASHKIVKCNQPVTFRFREIDTSYHYNSMLGECHRSIS